MSLRAAILCLALVSQVVSVKFVLPSNGANWTTSGPNDIEWTYGAGTPTFVNIQLLHNNNDSFQPIPDLLNAEGVFATGVDIVSSTIVFTPSCLSGNPSLPTGSGYSLRMFSETTNGTRTTLAMSNGTFNIIAADATECLGFGNGSTTSSSASTSTGTATGVATASANLSSSSSKSHAGAIAGGVIGGLVACLLVVAGTMMYNRNRRNARKRMTQQFVIKKGLVLGRPADNKDVELSERF